MAKIRKSNVKNFVALAILAIFLLIFFISRSNQMAANRNAVKDNITEVDKLIEKDLELYYPETPREVIKLYSKMVQTLYSGIEDEQIEALALKIRELYDEEFLEYNPKDRYLADLYSEIAIWNKAGRKIININLGEKDDIVTYNLEGVEYATVKISLTIEGKIKEIEKKRFLLRKNEQGRWKILGWELDGDIN